MIDLTADPSSRATREVVAELLGQKRKISTDGAFYLPFPDFLHCTEWTGPLWIELVERCGGKKLIPKLHPNFLQLTNLPDTSRKTFLFGKLPNIALAQAIQQIIGEK